MIALELPSAYHDYDKCQETSDALALQKGVLTCVQTKESTLEINYRPEQISLRSLVQECQTLGHYDAHFKRQEDNSDIRQILAQESRMYQTRLGVGLLFWLPIMVLAWIVPYSNPEFLTVCDVYKGCTIYVMMMFFFATVIQIGLGAPFYKGAYKSIRAGAANMDVLVVLGTTSAWLYGVILIFVGHSRVYSMDFEMLDSYKDLENPQQSYHYN